MSDESKTENPKAKADKTAISPRRAEDFPEWYQQVVDAADLAENSDVRGCMVIKPWGYGIWERMQARARSRCSRRPATRTPISRSSFRSRYLEKEAEHVEGFAKECAVVTHHRLEAGPDGKLRPAPAAELTEPLVVRPTSETIIGATYAKWVQSLPRSADPDQPMGQRRALGNAPAPVPAHRRVPLAGRPHRARDRAPRPSRRRRKCSAFTRRSPGSSSRCPSSPARRAESERFPGAVQTLCIEAMVQDRKAIQAGTSHFLGQNFSKASGIKFQSREGQRGIRLDDELGREHAAHRHAHHGARGRRRPDPAAARGADADRHPAHHAQARDARRRARGGRDAGGATCASAVSTAQPLRVRGRQARPRRRRQELGVDQEGCARCASKSARAIWRSGTVALCRRDQGAEGEGVPPGRSGGRDPAGNCSNAIQDTLYARAPGVSRRAHPSDRHEGGVLRVFHRARTPTSRRSTAASRSRTGTARAEVEEKIKEDLKVTIRCIPFGADEPGVCPFSGQPSARRVIWAKSY